MPASSTKAWKNEISIDIGCSSTGFVLLDAAGEPTDTVETLRAKKNGQIKWDVVNHCTEAIQVGLEIQTQGGCPVPDKKDEWASCVYTSKEFSKNLTVNAKLSDYAGDWTEVHFYTIKVDSNRLPEQVLDPMLIIEPPRTTLLVLAIWLLLALLGGLLLGFFSGRWTRRREQTRSIGPDS